MGDREPAKAVIYQTHVASLASLMAKMEQHKLELLQLEARREQVLVNMKATEKAIDDTQKQLDIVKAEGT